jgi:hypothetical protein
VAEAERVIIRSSEELLPKLLRRAIATCSKKEDGPAMCSEGFTEEVTCGWVLQRLLSSGQPKRTGIGCAEMKNISCQKKNKTIQSISLVRNQLLETTYKLQQSRRFLIHSQQV